MKIRDFSRDMSLPIQNTLAAFDIKIGITKFVKKYSNVLLGYFLLFGCNIRHALLFSLNRA